MPLPHISSWINNYDYRRIMLISLHILCFNNHILEEGNKQRNQSGLAEKLKIDDAIKCLVHAFFFLFYFLFIVLRKITSEKNEKSSIHPHIIRKLKPMNRPRVPPQSARSELKGYASSSLRTRMLSLENIGQSCVVPFTCFFNFPVSCITLNLFIVWLS